MGRREAGERRQAQKRASWRWSPPESNVLSAWAWAYHDLEHLVRASQVDEDEVEGRLILAARGGAPLQIHRYDRSESPLGLSAQSDRGGGGIKRSLKGSETHAPTLPHSPTFLEYFPTKRKGRKLSRRGLCKYLQRTL